MIVFQSTALIGKCPNCGTDDVRQVDVTDTATNRTLKVICEACIDTPFGDGEAR